MCHLRHSPRAARRSPDTAANVRHPQSCARPSISGHCASIAAPAGAGRCFTARFPGGGRSAVDHGRTGDAQEALERAETGLLDHDVAVNSTQNPDDRRAVLDIAVARQALAAGDLPGALRAIDDALAASDLVARPAPPLPAPRPAAAVAAPAPPRPPPVTYALLPGHWQLEGALCVPPAATLRRVESRPFIEGSFDWCDGEWRWVPAHYGSHRDARSLRGSHLPWEGAF